MTSTDRREPPTRPRTGLQTKYFPEWLRGGLAWDFRGSKAWVSGAGKKFSSIFYPRLLWKLCCALLGKDQIAGFLRFKNMNFTSSFSWGCVLLAVGKLATSAQPLIVDHTAVAQLERIPPEYIARVKEMWVSIPGESHSSGYRKGCILLSAQYPQLTVSVRESGVPEMPTNTHLRVSSATYGPYGWNYYGYGEADWYTNPEGIAKVKRHLAYCNTNAFGLTAIGFGWCWDATWHNPPGGGIDPVHQVRWAGASEGGPDGDLRWGLDAEDTVLTGNRVCMDTYLSATQAYEDFCRTNGYETRVFFTTGPVDGYNGESGYQRQLKYDHIRTYVAQSTNAILFDYADILSWNDAGELHSETWVDFGGTPKTYHSLHPDNLVDLNGSYVEDGDHIGERGAVRLAKALWVMLARMAGWNPDSTPEPTAVAIRPAEGGHVIHFLAASNTSYTVEFNPGFSTNSWFPLTNVISQPFDRQIEVVDPATNSQRFYRVSAWRAP